MKNDQMGVNKTANSINSIISNDKFTDLSDDVQNELLHEIVREQKGGGIVGKFFGNDKELIPLYFSFVTCVILLIIGVLIWFKSGEIQIWTVILPVVTSMIGFMFGRTGK